MIKRGLASALVLALLAGAGLADSGTPVVTTPVPVTSQGGNASGTITTTSTFQKIFPATALDTQSSGPGVLPSRRGCTIQNNSTHTMYVTEGLGVTASTTGNSAQISGGATFYCGALGGPVLSGEIDITGTSGDAFYAVQY